MQGLLFPAKEVATWPGRWEFEGLSSSEDRLSAWKDYIETHLSLAYDLDPPLARSKYELRVLQDDA
eukprot:1850950-Amphidinium_carterae.1